MTAPEYQALFNGGRGQSGDSVVPLAVYVFLAACLLTLFLISSNDDNGDIE